MPRIQLFEGFKKYDSRVERYVWNACEIQDPLSSANFGSNVTGE